MARNSEEYYPEKVVILHGPTLGTSLKLIIFGALLGSAGTFYWLRQNADNKTVEQGTRRAREVWKQGMQLASSAAGFAKSTFPQWQEAVHTARTTAAQTEQQLQHQIDDAEIEESDV